MPPGFFVNEPLPAENERKGLWAPLEQSAGGVRAKFGQNILNSLSLPRHPVSSSLII